MGFPDGFMQVLIHGLFLDLFLKLSTLLFLIEPHPQRTDLCTNMPQRLCVEMLKMCVAE